ncbi:MAG: hypothetical protein GYA36_18870 [Veillonellaceae bacterium]|nr:hypothetical protein [Veillonellaceae bacterium]
MTRKPRVKGGEKNTKSGQKWSREELGDVLDLYISDPELKIHESNEIIQKLAVRLNRTTRSVEAQLLMFRSLDRMGFYGYKNMNKLCRELWKEYINKTMI